MCRNDQQARLRAGASIASRNVRKYLSIELQAGATKGIAEVFMTLSDIP
jgi:hypothetical protein